MARDVLQKVRESSIYPDHVMANVAKSVLPAALAVSLLVHLAVVGVTSVGFIGKCVKHGTLHPKQAIQNLREQEESERIAEERRERLQQAREEVDEPATDSAGGGTAEDAGGELPEAGAETADDGGMTPIEREINEGDTSRPPVPDATFDNVDDL
jgi:hypothetical protein